MGQAFTAVLNAEKAGANVTSLLNQLNEATGLLTQAENAYTTGNTNAAVNDASAVLPITQHVAAEAQTAKQTASSVTQTNFTLTISTSIVAVAVLVLALFLVWRRLKRNYIGRLHETKLEGALNEA